MTTNYHDTPTPEQPDLLPLVSKPDNGSSRKVVMGSLFIFAALVGITSYVAFSGNGKSATSSGPVATSVQAPAAIAPAIVSITNSGFVPGTISIKVGQAVAWTNTDSSSHYVTSDDPKPTTDTPNPDSQAAISQNNSYDYVFDKAGVYSYHDDNNPSFRATVVVK